MANIISPNMNLIIPGVGTEAGPTYAFDVNASLTLIDQHDHTPGKGVQIPSAGVNINAALDFHSNNAINMNSIVFGAQASASTILQSLSVAPGTGGDPTFQDLFYTDNNGNQVQLTKNGLPNTGAATIPGESYAGGTFFWKQTQSGLPTTPANFDIGNITLRPNVAATTHGVVLLPLDIPQYSLTLPAVAPSGTYFLTIDTSGNITPGISTSGGIGTSNIANNAITTAKIADGSVTAAKLAAGAVEFSFASFTTPGTTTWVVPAGVTFALVKMVGGGGGGGGGGGNNGVANPAGGGGGGSNPIESMIPVTPGETINVHVGTAGGGGAADNSGGGAAGAAGGNGGGSSIDRGAAPLLQVLGGLGATLSGPGNGIGGLGGYNSNGLRTQGGNGGVSGTGTSQDGQGSFEGNGGSGAVPFSNGGGGGGGGAGWGNGGNGGLGNGGGGGNGSTPSGWGAGGGGGSGSPANGGNGGNGGTGRVDFYYLA